MVDLNLQHMGPYHLSKEERGTYNGEANQRLHPRMEEQGLVKTQVTTEIQVMEGT